MTAFAFTAADNAAVQLAPVVDSRLAIDPAVELTSDTMRDPNSPVRSLARARSLKSLNLPKESGYRISEDHPASPRPFSEKNLAQHESTVNGTPTRSSSSQVPSSNHTTTLSASYLAPSSPSPAPGSPSSSSHAAKADLLSGNNSSSPSLNANGLTPHVSTARTSTNSEKTTGHTSNSSYIAPPQQKSTPSDGPTQPIPPRPSTSSRPQSDPDHTAMLIQNLYARLDTQGVPGDGWDEGMERSRDGIINREVAEGQLTMTDRNKGKQVMTKQDTESQEDKVLKRVDRYGFFSSSHPAALASQHNRLATLAASSFATIPMSSRIAKVRPKANLSAPHASSQNTKVASNDRRGSIMSISTPMDPASIALETKRIDKWSEMLQVAKRDKGGNVIEWDLAPTWWDGRDAGRGKYRRLQRRVFKGVPDRWRRAVWGLEIERIAKEELKRGTSKVKSLEELQREYRTLIDQPSMQDVQIDLDVPRTISGHVLFHTRYGQGQRSLFHVLHAFGLNCQDIGGYCQGMGPIAATLLCYFEAERVYAALVRLFDQYHLRHIFEPGFTGLMETFYVQERLVEWLMPDVHKAFQDHMISTSAYATKWYITLFANSVPFATQLRLWDGLLLEGLDFVVIVAVAIIWSFKTDFASPIASFESILSTLSSYFFVESDDALLRWIRKVLRMKDVRRKMQEWRREWQGFVKDGTADRRVT